MSNQHSEQKLYTPREAYHIIAQAFRTLPHFRYAMAAGILDEQFKERIMLTVTKVNGCTICSDAHTQAALDAGISRQEVTAMLSGDHSGTPREELSGILFAQHCAYMRGKPSKACWTPLLHQYGPKKAVAILGAVRMIMLGNALGISLGSLKARLNSANEKIDSRSNPLYEMQMLCAFIVLFPAGLIRAFADTVMRKPFIST